MELQDPHLEDGLLVVAVEDNGEILLELVVPVVVEMLVIHPILHQEVLEPLILVVAVVPLLIHLTALVELVDLASLPLDMQSK